MATPLMDLSSPKVADASSERGSEEMSKSVATNKIVVLHDSDWCAKTFGDLLEDTSSHDVTFKTSDGSSVGGHRLIVAAGSPVFHAMLYGNMKESNEKEIELPSVDSATLSNLLIFLYTGKIMFDSECFENILDAARFFNISSLEAKVAVHIAKSLDTKNFYSTINVAVSKKFDQLLEHCLNFMYVNASELICSSDFSNLPAEVVLTLCKSSDLDIKEVDLFLALVEWHRHMKSDASEDIVRTIFQEVRYPLISKDDLYNIVRPTKVADSSLYTAALEYHLFPKKYDGLVQQITSRQGLVQIKSCFTNLTPTTITMTESPSGTTFTKVGKSSWNGMCVAEIYPTSEHPVHFKFCLFCSSYNGIRIAVLSCPFKNLSISSPVGVTVDGLAVDQEVDGYITVDGNSISTTIGNRNLKFKKQLQSDPIFLCLFMFHTNSAVKISILNK